MRFCGQLMRFRRTAAAALLGSAALYFRNAAAILGKALSKAVSVDWQVK